MNAVGHGATVTFIVPVAEEQSQAPQGANAYQGVDDPGHDGGLSSANPGYQVEAEYADQSPVNAADNGQRQGDPVNDVHEILSFQGTLSHSGE